MECSSPTRGRVLSLVAATAAAAGSHLVVWYGVRSTWPPPPQLSAVSWSYWTDLWMLAYALLLALPAPRPSGLVIGRIRENARGVALVCGVPLLLTAIVYPLLPTRPFAGASSSMWTISPAAQDLVFFGFVYRVLDGPWKGRVVARLPVEWPLLLTALTFAAWHVPNFSAMPAGYVLFQLVYVFAGACVAGLARQWTGSLLYGWALHTAANAIAWAAS